MSSTPPDRRSNEARRAADRVTAAGAERRKAVVDATEQERRRWARELHDETLQGLGALRVSLSWALKHGGHEDLTDAVEGAVDQLANEIASLRRLIALLRPAALDDLGLADALVALAGPDVETEVTIEAQLDPELEGTIYRIVQEALTNARRHAQADRVVVRVLAAEDVAQIEVRDDGAGFDTGAPRRGRGLVGIEERVELAQGELELESMPGRGTSVRIRLPVAG